jgi:hypothetical protein
MRMSARCYSCVSLGQCQVQTTAHSASSSHKPVLHVHALSTAADTVPLALAQLVLLEHMCLYSMQPVALSQYLVLRMLCTHVSILISSDVLSVATKNSSSSWTCGSSSISSSSVIVAVVVIVVVILVHSFVCALYVYRCVRYCSQGCQSQMKLPSLFHGGGQAVILVTAVIYRMAIEGKSQCSTTSSWTAGALNTHLLLSQLCMHSMRVA